MFTLSMHSQEAGNAKKQRTRSEIKGDFPFKVNTLVSVEYDGAMWDGRVYGIANDYRCV